MENLKTGMLIFRKFESHFEDVDFFADLKRQEKTPTKVCDISGLATVCENDLLTIICNINSCLLAEYIALLMRLKDLFLSE